MIGLDTNVLIRYFTQDDEAQARAASQLIGGLTDDEPGFISVVVLVEMIWVLRRSYRLPHDEILVLVEDLMRTRELRIQHPAEVQKALRSSRASSADFADALTSRLGISAGCETTVTFDRAASKLDGMKLLTTH